MRMLDGGSGSGPSIPIQAVLPGHQVSEGNGEARLILLLPPLKNGKIQASFPLVHHMLAYNGSVASSEKHSRRSF